MQINTLRNSLLRARNLRSARRSRSSKILNNRLSYSSNSSKTESSKNNTSQTTSTSTVKSKQIAMYEKMESSAANIQKNVKSMINIGKMQYTDDETGKKAKENDRQMLISNIKNFVSDYNMVYSALDDISGTANIAYKKSLDTVVSVNKDALSELGITVLNSGELSIDEKILANADEKKVKDMFAGEDSFATKISSKMENIEKNASSSVTALNKLYGTTSNYDKNGTGNSYSYYNGSYNTNSNWYI